MLGLFRKKIDPLKELRKLLYIRISRFAGMIYGYEEKSYEIVSLVNAYPSIINALSHVAFEMEWQQFKPILEEMEGLNHGTKA